MRGKMIMCANCGKVHLSNVHCEDVIKSRKERIGDKKEDKGER